MKSIDVLEKSTTLLSIRGTTELPAMGGEKTTSYSFSFFQKDFNSPLLPATQRKTAACVITGLEIRSDSTFAELAAAIVGVSIDTSLRTISRLLKRRGYLMTLLQADELTKIQRGCNHETGVHMGLGNFFFVEKRGDESISVASLLRSPSKRASAREGHFWLGFHSFNNPMRWGVQHPWQSGYRRLLLNNLNISELDCLINLSK